MIRKQINFKVSKDVEISYNYQHELLKNLYKLMKLADEKKAKILHNTGYRLEGKHVFKLFNYTLLFENAVFTSTGILCKEDTKVKLVLNGKKEIVENILRGLLVEPQLQIETAVFDLVGVKDDKKINLKEVTLYKALSAIVISTKTDNGEKEYLNPYDTKYFENLANNLKRKYILIYGKEYTGELFFEIDNLLEMREKFVKIKSGGVKGQEYSIWVQADKDMQKVIYYLGLGQNSSIGCGCLSFVKGVSEGA